MHYWGELRADELRASVIPAPRSLSTWSFDALYATVVSAFRSLSTWSLDILCNSKNNDELTCTVWLRRAMLRLASAASASFSSEVTFAHPGARRAVAFVAFARRTWCCRSVH